MGAVRAVAGELEHARAQGGEHERHRLGRLGRPVDGQVEGVQVLAHRGHRAAVVVPAQLHGGAWLTPRPSTKRPSNASASAFAAALVAAGSRA